MKNSVFDYSNYKQFLSDILEARSEKGRGQRSRLAAELKCHSAYVSQVLNGASHFSLEQADLAATFLGLTETHRHFLLLIVQENRAGTQSLKEFFRSQMKKAVDANFVLKDRLEYQKTLTREDQATFYSSWIYGAVHVIVSIPGCETERGISEYLGLPVDVVSRTLEFLLSVGLITKHNGKYKVGTSHIHLESHSPMISKHHSNWRIQSIQSLDSGHADDLHYSSVITISKADVLKAKEILVAAIEDIRKVVRPSKDEESYAYAIDLFSLRARR